MDWDIQCDELAECAVWEEWQAMRQAELESDLDCEDDGEYEDDGQPSEYEEWQDFYGGDDWDHGQYDSCEEW